MGHDLDAVRAANPIDRVVGRDVTWDPRKGNAARGDLWACCPLHDEGTPSFHVDVGKGLWHCFGCQQGGDVFAYVTARTGCSFAEAVARLAADGGVTALEDPARRAAREADRQRRQAEAERARQAEGKRKRASARDIWREAEEGHPLIAGYLEARGVDVGAIVATRGQLPPVLRLHPALPYLMPDGRGALVEVHRGPAMVAAVGRVVVEGVHRTWITAQGRASVDGVKLDKRMLGECYGRPVRFRPPTSRMVVGEGIETTLAVWSRLLRRGEVDWSADAALSRGALAGQGDPIGKGPASRTTGRTLPSGIPDWVHPGWQAPDGVDDLVILAEGSTKCPETAERLTLCAMRRHALRPNGRARNCTYRLPGGRWDSGLDFADVAVAERSAEGAA